MDDPKNPNWGIRRVPPRANCGHLTYLIRIRLTAANGWRRWRTSRLFTGFCPKPAVLGNGQGSSRCTSDRAPVTPGNRSHLKIVEDVNATGSPAGIAYAAKYSDLVFITSPAEHEIDAALAALPAHNAVIKAAGAARGRKLCTIINPMVVYREAQRYHQAILDAAERGAIEGFVAHQRTGDAVAWQAHGDTHRALGGNIQIIGSPEHIADKLISLKHAGCDGIQIALFDFAQDLEFFGHEVLPLINHVGLRDTCAGLQSQRAAHPMPSHAMPT
jgi:Luciferase-like monooxygenase